MRSKFVWRFCFFGGLGFWGFDLWVLAFEIPVSRDLFLGPCLRCVDNNITPWDQANLVLKSIGKLQPGFLLSLISMLLESNWEKILITQFSLPKFRYFADQNGPNGGPHENEFWQFSNKCKNKYCKQLKKKYGKVDKKNGVICLVSIFHSELWSLHYPKLCIFWKFLLTSARNLYLLKQFNYIHLKYFFMLFQKVLCFIGVSTVTRYWRIKHQKSAEPAEFNKIYQLQTLISSKP